MKRTYDITLVYIPSRNQVKLSPEPIAHLQSFPENVQWDDKPNMLQILGKWEYCCYTHSQQTIHTWLLRITKPQTKAWFRSIPRWESSCITVLLMCLPTKSILLLTWILLWPAPCCPGLLSSWSYSLRVPLIVLPQALVLGFAQTPPNLFSTSLLLFLCFPGAFVFWFWTSPPSSSCFWSLLVYWSWIALLVMVFHSAYTPLIFGSLFQLLLQSYSLE